MSIRTAILVGVAALAGCSRAPLSGPPELRLGREECAECGMLVSEDRFSSVSLILRDDERVYAFFDDIGCMLDHQEEHADIPVLQQYVHDHGTRGWVSAGEATYVLAGDKTLPTPMGSGIAAFATRAAAEELGASAGGEIMDLGALAGARRRWLEQRMTNPTEERP